MTPTLLTHHPPRPLLTTRLPAHPRTLTDPLQLCFSTLDAFCLDQRQVRVLLANAFWVIGIHLRRNLLLHARPELRSFRITFELFFRLFRSTSFECLFVDLDFFRDNVVTSHWNH